MKNHEIDLKLLDKVMNKRPQSYKSRKKEKGKRDFKHKATRITHNQKFAPLLLQFRDIYYQKYMNFSKCHFAKAVGEHLTNICEYKLFYRPGEGTIFKDLPSVEFPKNDDPVLYLNDPILDQNKDQDEVVYEISATIKIKKISG